MTIGYCQPRAPTIHLKSPWPLPWFAPLTTDLVVPSVGSKDGTTKNKAIVIEVVICGIIPGTLSMVPQTPRMISRASWNYGACSYTVSGCGYHQARHRNTVRSVAGGNTHYPPPRYYYDQLYFL